MEQCLKVKYNSYKIAMASLYRIIGKGEKRNTTPCRVYECSECKEGTFHLTHQTTEEFLEHSGEKVELIYKEQWSKLI